MLELNAKIAKMFGGVGGVGNVTPAERPLTGP